MPRRSRSPFVGLLRAVYNTHFQPKGKEISMAREKGMGNLQREKSGRWTMRVGIDGKRYCRSTRTKDRDQAERVLQRFLAPLGLGEHRLPLADVWLEYVKPPRSPASPRSHENILQYVLPAHIAQVPREHIAIYSLSPPSPRSCRGILR